MAKKPKTTKRPYEFFYIDLSRVGAYLAQLEGGSYVKKHLAEKIVNKVNGEVTVQSVLKAGASSETEDFVEREVTPTAASLFVELVQALDKDGSEGFLRNFREYTESKSGGNKSLEEGEFVLFHARLHAPLYVEPYVGVHHAATLAALFPRQGKGRVERRLAQRQRKAARKFERQVGRNPRFVLTVRPRQKGTDERVTVLMPVHLRQLTEERSLQSSGGEFTVLGKVVRLSTPWRGPEYTPQAHADQYTYIDSATRELWRQPLAVAPKSLICQADPACTTTIENSGTHGRKRKELARAIHRHIEKGRRHMLEALKTGTEIKRGGAVILPIGIYR